MLAANVFTTSTFITVSAPDITTEVITPVLGGVAPNALEPNPAGKLGHVTYMPSSGVLLKLVVRIVISAVALGAATA